MKQEAGVGGTTDEKDREETELEEVAYILGQAGALFFRDPNPTRQESLAGELDLTPSKWGDLRDQQLLAKSQLVVDRLLPLTTGAQAATAATYGITPASVASLVKERKDYDDIVNAPEAAIAIRVALTKGFRAAVRLVEGRFKELDKLVLQFGKTESGKTLVKAWKAARTIKGPGQGSDEEKPTPPAPPQG